MSKRGCVYGRTWVSIVLGLGSKGVCRSLGGMERLLTRDFFL